MGSDGLADRADQVRKRCFTLYSQATSSALAALSDAADKSLANVPRFDDRTLIALDGSGSMNGRPLASGSLFAAVLAKADAQADVLVFSNDANFVTLNRCDSTRTLTGEIARRAPGGGTNVHAIFQKAKAAGDRGGGGE